MILKSPLPYKYEGSSRRQLVDEIVKDDVALTYGLTQNGK